MLTCCLVWLHEVECGFVARADVSGMRWRMEIRVHAMCDMGWVVSCCGLWCGPIRRCVMFAVAFCGMRHKDLLCRVLMKFICRIVGRCVVLGNVVGLCAVLWRVVGIDVLLWWLLVLAYIAYWIGGWMWVDGRRLTCVVLSLCVCLWKEKGGGRGEMGELVDWSTLWMC